MSKSGPQQYPGASLKYDFRSAFEGSDMESNVICLHSTEGNTVPTYSGGATAPNITAAPDFKNKRAIWYQHFDFDESARALVNAAGGVQTNTANVNQIEIVGTCDPATHAKWVKAGIEHLYMPELPTWFKDELAAYIAWAHKNHGVKIQSKRPNGTALVFKPYPASYGKSNGVRLTASEWDGFYGVLGHQHATENLHGDPGNIDIGYILSKAAAIAGGTATPPVVVKPKYEPFPGANFFKTGRKSPVIKAMHLRLIAVGCDRYQSNLNPDVWGSGDVASYAAWQRKRGFSGASANGIPGKLTWDALKVPNV